MKKTLTLTFFFLLSISQVLFAQDIKGFWKTINDKTNKPESIVAIYEYQGKYFGRIILTYDDNGQVKDTIYKASERAPGVKGNPYYAGLDIIWNLKPNNSKFSDGKILDPEKGRVYDAEAWHKNGNLIVRGEILFFGENETWPPAAEHDFPAGFIKPNLAQLIPSIPQVKH
jgi:uncharacterized protein (DUF2147 family)